MATVSILGLSLTITPPILALLRLAPALSATASLTHAWMEDVTTRACFQPPATRSSLILSMAQVKPTSASTEGPNHVSAELIAARELATPAWFVNFFDRGVWSVIGLNSLTLLSGAANVWLLPEGLKEYRNVYAVGFAAAMAHYAFVPLVAPSIERLCRMCLAQEGVLKLDDGKNAAESMREWNLYHRIRVCTVDLLAWGSFVVAAAGTLSL